MSHLLHLKSFLLASVLTALTLSLAWAREKFKVVTIFTTTTDMVSNVADDVAGVSSTTKPGAEIHEYQPIPGDIKRVQDAQLTLFNDLNLKLWFARSYQNLSGAPEVMTSNDVQPMGISEGPYNGKPNPHTWMSVESVPIRMDNIRDALTKYSPDNSATYQNDTQNYKARIQQTLAPLHIRPIKLPTDKHWLVINEGVFPYLTRNNNLKELYLWSINADQQGTPKQVRKAIDTIRAYHIPTVFNESTVSNKPACQIARESGAHYDGVLYVDSFGAADDPVPTYLDPLRVTTQTTVNGINKGLGSQL